MCADLIRRVVSSSQRPKSKIVHGKSELVTVRKCSPLLSHLVCLSFSHDRWIFLNTIVRRWARISGLFSRISSIRSTLKIPRNEFSPYSDISPPFHRNPVWNPPIPIRWSVNSSSAFNRWLELPSISVLFPSMPVEPWPNTTWTRSARSTASFFAENWICTATKPSPTRVISITDPSTWKVVSGRRNDVIPMGAWWRWCCLSIPIPATVRLSAGTLRKICRQWPVRSIWSTFKTSMWQSSGSIFSTSMDSKKPFFVSPPWWRICWTWYECWKRCRPIRSIWNWCGKSWRKQNDRWLLQVPWKADARRQV